MNLNKINVHKSSLLPCLKNSFLKKVTYIRVVVRAVQHDEIGHGSFTTMSSLSISLMLFLSEKTNCHASTCLHINFNSYVKASFLQLAQQTSSQFP
jgi:hypothetical protein